MALIGNYSRLYVNPLTYFGGVTGQGKERSAFNQSGKARGVFSNDAWEPKSGVPDGYRPPYAWVLPQTAGALAARNRLTGSGALTGTGAMGRNAEAALTGTGAITGTGGLVVSAIAALSGSGALSGSLVAVLNAAATLAGSGAVAGTIGALAYASAALAGSGSLTGTRYALGHLAADITPFSELSPESLAAAVWAAVAADSNDTGTMGEKLNDAGSASNPWTEVIEGSFTAAEMLRIIAAALAGELSGAATTTITISGIDGSTDRIVATVTAAGDRTAVVLDGS